MTDKLLNQLSLVEAIKAIESGDSTAEAIINACYDQIDAREPQVAAWQYSLTREQYLHAYHANEAFFKGSRLKGLPGVSKIQLILLLCRLKWALGSM